MQRAIHIKFAVALNDLRRPCAVVALAPGEVLRGSHRAVVGPVHHIGRGVELPVEHLETVALGIVFVMPRVEEHRVVIDHRCRVGSVFGLDDGILRLHRSGAEQGCAKQSPSCGFFFQLFHCCTIVD